MNAGAFLRNHTPNILRKTYLLGKRTLLPDEIKMGRGFSKTLRRLDESQWWSKEQIIAYQLNSIKAILSHAYKTVPYYQKLFRKEGIHPEDITTFADFESIPFLTKENIRNNITELLSKDYPKNKVVKISTGGTTGSPVEFYAERQTNVKENAFHCRFWDWFGYRPGDRCAVLRADNKTTRHRYNIFQNYLEIACGDLSEGSIASYLNELKKFKPSFMRAYPSLAYLVAIYINRTGQDGNYDFIKTVFCASEQLFTFQRNEIKKAFNCRVIESYGHSEKAVLMHQCEKEANLHVMPEYGYTEFIDINGNTIKESGKLGEIVATGFNNYAFPFIRYRTGDLAILAKNRCECRRNFQEVEEIQGRCGDYIITPYGKRISPTVLEFAFDSVRNVEEWQVIQRSKTLIEILIVKAERYDQKSEATIKTGLQEIIKEDIKLKITYVDSIEKPQNMKRRFVICELDLVNAPERS